MTESDNTHDYGLFDEIAEEFAERLRRGEKPSLQEYADRFPKLEAEIRDLFPALVEAEEAHEMAEFPASRLPRGILADFRIIGEIGRGGMGVVYEAEQVSLGRSVALKVLSLSLRRDARSLERFRREARSAAQLHHTNIVPIFEIGEEQDSAYYAMQYIRGQALNLVIEDLKRLRNRSREEARVPDSGKPASIGPAGSETEEVPGLIAKGVPTETIALSVLAGRLYQQSTVPGEAGRVAVSPGGLGSIAGRPDGADFGHRTESAHSTISPSSAVWPDGGTISMSESFGRRQPFFRSVAEIGRQVAGGLAYAHARGIVHRDIKPANLLLDTAGVAWIADFGLAKSTDASLTDPGDILGTLRFMAPERFMAEGDARVDIYGLGATLYEMLTLRPAFDSPDRLRLIEQIRNVEPPRPRSIDPAIPRDLETIIIKAMAKVASARYGTAAEMSEDLRRFLAGEAIRARRVGPPERLLRWSQRNPLVASLAAIMSMLILLTIVMTKTAAQREHVLRIEAETARNAAERSLSDLREARTDESTFLRAIAAERENLRLDPSNRRVQGSLDALYSQQGSLQRRTGRNAEAIATALSRREINPGEPDRLYLVAMDLADCYPRPGKVPEAGDLDAAGAERAAGLAIETLGRALLAGYQSNEYNLTFSIQSDPLFQPLHAFPAYQSLLRAIGGRDLPNGNGELRAFRGQKGVIESVAFSRDGMRALSVESEGSARLWETSTGIEVLPPFLLPNAIKVAAISPDGGLAALGCLDGSIYFWNLNDGAKVGQLDTGGGLLQGLGFTPDGKTLVSGGRDGLVRIWDLEKRSQRGPTEGHRGELHALAMSPNGRQVVTVGADETVRVWDVGSGRPVHEPLRGHHGRVWSVAISPDGRRALTGGEDGCLIEWDLAEGRRLRVLWGHWATIRGIAISPDGRRALTGGTQNRLLYWDLESGRELHRFPGNFGGGMVGVAISPDGQRALTGGTDRIARVWSLSEDAALARDRVIVGHWDDAIEAYTRAVRTSLNDQALLGEISRLNWKLGRWSNLVILHDKMRRRAPDVIQVQLNSARVMLMAGDLDGYRRFCAAMKERTAWSKDVNNVWKLSLIRLLAPDSGADLSAAERLAVPNEEQNPNSLWIRHVRGLAQYRGGRHEEAVATLLPLALDHSDWGEVSRTWPSLALAYHGLGNQVEARKWLEKTRDLRRRSTPRFGRDPIVWAGPWSDEGNWIDFELLAREAEATLGEPPTVP